MAFRYGLTEAVLVEGKLKITHTGNMGNRIKNVKENIEKMFHFDPYTMFVKISETGSPDYFYEAVFDLDKPIYVDKIFTE